MIIKLAEDLGGARKVLTHPVIYDCISSDNAPKVEDYKISWGHYLCGYFNDEPIAVMVFHPKNATAWQCHIQVLPDYRNKSDEFAQLALDWWFSHSKTILVAEIPSLYPNVLYFGLKHGFKIDGRTDNAYLKNGKMHSIYYLSKEVPDGLG